MALVSDGFDLRVALTDSSGTDVSHITYKLVAADAAAAATATTTILGLLAAVSDAVVKGYSISQRFVEDAITLPANTELENRAVVVCAIDGNPLKTATIVIPAANSDIFQSPTGAGRNLINVANTDLLAYIDIWQVTGALASISDGEFLDNTSVIRSGKRSHRANNDG